MVPGLNPSNPVPPAPLCTLGLVPLPLCSIRSGTGLITNLELLVVLSNLCCLPCGVLVGVVKGCRGGALGSRRRGEMSGRMGNIDFHPSEISPIAP